MTAPNEPRDAVASDETPTREEIAAILLEEGIHQPAPPPTPVRARHYLTECEHCGWVGSSEHLGVDEDDISCPVCCQSICGDGPDEADTAKHGEAVYQRIVTAEAEIERLRGRAEAAEAALEREGEALQEEIELHAEASAELVTLREQLAAAEARAEGAEKTVSEHAEYIIDLEHLSYIRADLTWRDEATRLNAALSEERARVAGMRQALGDTKAASDEMAEACLSVSDNHGAGALQFISGFVSDQLFALTPEPPHEA